ncbi:MAG TPA: tetratricopeptide repeat protein [Polyangiaceae bacterium]|nr:tetratricopeptide repeat protein [Polyangiaceae bacterium]
MSQPNLPGSSNGQPNLQLQGGAAIVAPVSAFPGGVPGNALIVLPLGKPGDELVEAMKKGPVALEIDRMWEMLGFNGPAVQVQDADGRPIAIGLEDLLSGLEKHWQEDSQDLNRGRLYAQELMKYSRFEQAEKVLAKVVALGGTGEDWLALGVTQVQQEKWDKAEGTLRGAQNLLPDNPFPALHLAKAFRGKGNLAEERAMVEQAIQVAPNSVDAWAYLFTQVQRESGDEAGEAAVTELANREANAKTAAPFIAIQGVYSGMEDKRDKAITFAKKAVERNENDPLALICLSALYGQSGDLDKVIEVLSKHEAKMANDVRLAHNYFEALFQKRQLDRVTKLLNALAGSQNREVKQFAIERSRMVAQYLQQQQQQLAAGAPRRA